jgi:hypothetical protein
VIGIDEPSQPVLRLCGLGRSSGCNPGGRPLSRALRGTATLSDQQGACVNPAPRTAASSLRRLTATAPRLGHLVCWRRRLVRSTQPKFQRVAAAVSGLDLQCSRQFVSRSATESQPSAPHEGELQNGASAIRAIERYGIDAKLFDWEPEADRRRPHLSHSTRSTVSLPAMSRNVIAPSRGTTTTYHFPRGLGSASEGLLPARLYRAGPFSSLGLQIPFYKRAGFSRDSAGFCSSLVK